MSLEEQVLDTPGIDGVVLRYGRLYGPGTWYDERGRARRAHVDAAAHAALLAVTKGQGIYNIAEDDGAVSSEKARRELGSMRGSVEVMSFRDGHSAYARPTRYGANRIQSSAPASDCGSRYRSRLGMTTSLESIPPTCKYPA